MKTRKKLIEVALPLEAINVASAKEKSIRHGHPSTLHLWWARRPLAAARAVIFAQMVDDPSANPDLFPTEKAQEKERQRLFKIIEQLVLWENTTNERVLQAARDEIWQSWRRACANNADHPRAKELFNRHKLPPFYDPFAGGGALPLEAQRLGLDAYASDLNPVAVLINKAIIEIPPKFAGKPPVNPESQHQAKQMGKVWHGAQGLAEDVRYYGQWMRDEAEKRIGHLYSKVEITAEMAKARPDLKPHVGKKLTVIAWLWARTVKSPNPAFAEVAVPLISSFVLSSKQGKEAYVEPVVHAQGYEFRVKTGKDQGFKDATNGTKLARGANFRCVMSSAPISPDYVKAEGQAGRMGARLVAVVADSGRGRIFLSPGAASQRAVEEQGSSWKPDVEISGSTQYIGVRPYGMTRFSDLFTGTQLTMLRTFCDLVGQARERVLNDASARWSADASIAYANAVAAYLGLTVSKMTAYHCTLSVWRGDLSKTGRAFGRQAIQMVWDFAECNPFGEAGGDWRGMYEDCAGLLDEFPKTECGHAWECAAQQRDGTIKNGPIVSTDPPYYDNVPYSDLSDFYYVWLRRCVQNSFPDLFATVATPKKDELVAFAYRYTGKDQAEEFFMRGMHDAIEGITKESHPGFPITIYYAFRQSESDDEGGVSSTGWEKFLDAVARAGLGICGTWPMRTELSGALKTTRNALASSIILVCHPRPAEAPNATRREFLSALKSELPVALAHLQRSNIAPVDLAQAAIGPGMSVYTRYSKVLDASGRELLVREALALINQTLDEVLAEQEGDFDADTRWALAWFEQSGFAEGEYGVAETLSKAKNTSVAGMVEAGIVTSGRGKVRLKKADELPDDWDPEHEKRLTVWEMVHQLVRTVEAGGEAAAATLVAKLGSKAETARELAYRLYTICERKKRAQEALSYNALVQSWPEIMRLSRERARSAPQQAEIFE
jgi:putative DNA methylase